MLNLVTGYTLRDGTEVNLGDKLKGGNTHEVVVLIDKEQNKFIVEPIEERLKAFCFDLDEFLDSWYDIKKTGNVLDRVPRSFL